MTSISASSMSGYSPLDLLKQELTKEVSAGKVSSADQTALSSALDDIDSALQSGSSSSSSSSSAPPSPKEMQSKIDDLIQSEVDSGKLTSDQATELKNVFANAFSGGPGGAGGAGGPPPAPPSDDSSTDTTSSTSSSSSSSSSSQVEELLKKLLEALQSSNNSKTSSYSASGTSSSSSTSKSLVVDFSA
ncbi:MULTISPECIES: hypothetical protein [unclassified Bradyrhizobium]|uniref:hypothetical protein n=1 Tax=unclassified Bradyrhizobium TaxID=2631580 RepID=UPI002915F093|nr:MULTISPECIES: hypothetical protein [unclassified Bradyrhizobium]